MEAVPAMTTGLRFTAEQYACFWIARSLQQGAFIYGTRDECDAVAGFLPSDAYHRVVSEHGTLEDANDKAKEEQRRTVDEMRALDLPYHIRVVPAKEVSRWSVR